MKIKIRKKILISMILIANGSAYSATQNLAHSNPMLVEVEKMMPVVELGGDSSNVYGFVAHSQYANFISPYSAASFLLDYGSKQFRMDLTWAFAFTSDQRLKISGQQLSQNNNYNFVSGETDQFVGQTAVGAEYEYLLNRRVAHAFHIAGYYFSANDGDLNNITFTDTSGNFIDHRGIVGGKGGGVNMGPRLKFWKGSDLKLGFGYDQVSFNPVSEPANDSSGFGSNIYFTQKFSPKLVFEAAMENREPYQQYSADFLWMPYQKNNKQLGVKLGGRHVSSDVFLASSENIVGLSLVYKWDGNAMFSTETQCELTDTSCGLLAWSKQSVARLPSVFVQKDETVSSQ